MTITILKRLRDDFLPVYLHLNANNYSGVCLKIFQRSKVFKLIFAVFGEVNPNITSIFLGQVKFLRYD